MGNAFQQSDVIKGFELAIIHAVGGITIARESELVNFPGGGKEKHKQRHLSKYPECLLKFNKMALCPLIFEGHCQWAGFIKHNEDIWQCDCF